MITTGQFEFKMTSHTLGELLVSHQLKNRITIPNSYQREYVWGSIQINDLIESINSVFENYPNELNLILGDIILAHDKIKGIVNLVDGQQRFTTMFLILNYLSLKINNSRYKERLQAENGFILTYSDKLLDDNLKNILFNKNNNNYPINKAYSLIEELFEDEYSELIDNIGYENLFNDLLNKTIFGVKYIPTEYQEQIFNDINNKGVRLYQIDIIKSELFNKLKTEENKNKGSEYWRNIIETSNFIKSLNGFSRSNKEAIDILHQWGFYEYEIESNSIKSDYYERILKLSESEIIEYLKVANDFCKFVKNVYTENTKEYKTFLLLNEFFGYSYIPVAYKLINRNKKSLEETFKIIFKTFLSSVNRGNKTFSTYLQNLPFNLNINFELVKNTLNNVTYNGSGKKLIYSVLFLYDSYLKEKIEGSSIFDNIENLIKENKLLKKFRPTLDHIQPQSLNLNNHGIGNLTLLGAGINSSIQDGGGKHKIYRDSKYWSTKLLARDTNYGATKSILFEINPYLYQMTSSQIDDFDEENSKERTEIIVSFLEDFLKLE